MAQEQATKDKSGPIEGEYDVMDPNAKAVRRGSGNFDKTPRFTGTPSDDELAQMRKDSVITNKSEEAEKKGKGYKQLIAIPRKGGWLMRIRHHIEGKYYRCLQYQGYCPMCVSADLNDRSRTPSDAYINNIIWFDTDYKIKSIGNELAWRAAFTIVGGKKIERIREVLQMYDGNSAGLPFVTTLTNPAFRDWECAALPDRHPITKKIIETMTVQQSDSSLDWKESVFKRVEEEGLPKTVWEQFLCKSITAHDAIRQFDLKDQFDWAEGNKEDKSTHASESSKTQSHQQDPGTHNEDPGPAAFAQPQEQRRQPAPSQAKPPEQRQQKPAASSPLLEVLDEL